MTLSRSVLYLHRVARLSLLCVQRATHADGHLTRSEESSDRTTKVESSSSQRRLGATGGATTTFVRHLSDIPWCRHVPDMLFVFLFFVVVCQFHVFFFMSSYVFILFPGFCLSFFSLSPYVYIVVFVSQSVHGMFTVIGESCMITITYPGFRSASVGARPRRGMFQQEALCGLIVDVFPK